jgi:hypothetical protein
MTPLGTVQIVMTDESNWDSTANPFAARRVMTLDVASEIGFTTVVLHKCAVFDRACPWIRLVNLLERLFRSSLEVARGKGQAGSFVTRV